jgi:hypothetical protein
MKQFLAGSLIFLSALPALALGGVTVGNGGDSVAQEFTQFGQDAVNYFSYAESMTLSPQQQTAFKVAVESTLVQTQDQLFLNGAEVDAINYPSEKRIEVSRSRWAQNIDSTGNKHFLLAVHEYLWISGVDDSDYKISNPLSTILLAAKSNYLKNQGTMKCLTFIYKAADLVNPQLFNSLPIVEVKLNSSLNQTNTTLNGEPVTVAISKISPSSDIFQYDLVVGKASDIRYSDIIYNQGPAGSWDVIKGIRFTFSQYMNGVTILSPKFIAALQKTNKWKQNPYYSRPFISNDLVGGLNEDVKALLASKDLTPDDVVAAGTGLSCVLAN